MRPAVSEEDLGTLVAHFSPDAGKDVRAPRAKHFSYSWASAKFMAALMCVVDECTLGQDPYELYASVEDALNNDGEACNAVEKAIRANLTFCASEAEARSPPGASSGPHAATTMSEVVARVCTTLLAPTPPSSSGDKRRVLDLCIDVSLLACSSAMDSLLLCYPTASASFKHDYHLGASRGGEHSASTRATPPCWKGRPLLLRLLGAALEFLEGFLLGRLVDEPSALLAAISALAFLKTANVCLGNWAQRLWGAIVHVCTYVAFTEPTRAKLLKISLCIACTVGYTAIQPSTDTTSLDRMQNAFLHGPFGPYDSMWILKGLLCFHWQWTSVPPRRWQDLILHACRLFEPLSTRPYVESAVFAEEESGVFLGSTLWAVASCLCFLGAARQRVPTEPLPPAVRRALSQTLACIGDMFSEGAWGVGPDPPPGPIDLDASKYTLPSVYLCVRMDTVPDCDAFRAKYHHLCKQALVCAWDTALSLFRDLAHVLGEWNAGPTPRTAAAFAAMTSFGRSHRCSCGGLLELATDMYLDRRRRLAQPHTAAALDTVFQVLTAPRGPVDMLDAGTANPLLFSKVGNEDANVIALRKFCVAVRSRPRGVVDAWSQDLLWLIPRVAADCVATILVVMTSGDASFTVLEHLNSLLWLLHHLLWLGGDASAGFVGREVQCTPSVPRSGT